MIFNSIKKWFLRIRGLEPVAACTEVAGARQVLPETIEPETIESDCIDTAAPWTGVDLDGTLAHWDKGGTSHGIGKPVPRMLSFVQRMVESGVRVKIFTARAGDKSQRLLIRKWLRSNGLPQLEISNIKDYGMQRLYDDRSIQVERNTGRIISDLNSSLERRNQSE
jgi:hypothetical protein